MNNHMMVDIETMSTAPNAAILSIGAVIFDPNETDDERTLMGFAPCFSQAISMESNEVAGRHFGSATIAWWLRQNREAQAALFMDVTNLHQALVRFRLWVVEQAPLLVWANSPSFDLIILKNAYESSGERWPMTFRQERCVRTAKDMAFPNGDAPHIEVGAAHAALDDALKQALVIQACYRNLG